MFECYLKTYFLPNCTKYNTRFSNYITELIVALSLINTTKSGQKPIVSRSSGKKRLNCDHVLATLTRPMTMAGENLYFASDKKFINKNLTLKALIMTVVAFAACVVQDQAIQNVQPDLGSTLSALVKLCKQKQQ